MSTDFPLGIVEDANQPCVAVGNQSPDDQALEPSVDCVLVNSIEENNSGPVEFGRDPDLWLYRERTIALLKRYLRLSIEVGRLPSLLGRELFRSKVTAYRMTTFEDAVIFVHDVERVLDQLDALSKDLVAVIIFQDHSQEAAANILRCTRRTVSRHFSETLDAITDAFLEGGLLNRLPVRRPVEKSCQEGENARFSASIWKQAE